MRRSDGFVFSPAKRNLNENPNCHEKDSYMYGIRTQEISCVIQISMTLLALGTHLRGAQVCHPHPTS